jgi:hypothetical protein
VDFENIVFPKKPRAFLTRRKPVKTRSKKMGIFKTIVWPFDLTFSEIQNSKPMGISCLIYGRKKSHSVLDAS